MKKVYVEGHDHGIERMFLKIGYRVVGESVLADTVVFSGGSDVWPDLYGEEALPCTHFDRRRDFDCCELFDWAEGKKPMIGICRGGQFLHVMNGGRMWQDVDRHAIGGTHEVKDDDGSLHQVTSTHHQMMREVGDGQVITRANRSTYWLSANEKATEGVGWDDLEVVWYPNSRSLCYQPHPEYGSKSCLDHFVKQLERFDLR